MCAIFLIRAIRVIRGRNQKRVTTDNTDGTDKKEESKQELEVARIELKRTQGGPQTDCTPIFLSVPSVLSVVEIICHG